MDHPNAEWRVLLVDDDEDDYLITREMLGEVRGRNITLDWAPGYQVGQKMILDQAYEAILVDYDLGASSGIQFIREAVRNGCPVPLILYTGRGSYQVDLEAMEAGATLYLIKTEVTPLLLQRSLRLAIERSRIEHELRESENKFSVIFEKAAFAASLSKMPGNTLVNVNEAWTRLFGFTREEVRGKNIYELGIQPDLEIRAQVLDQLVEAGRVRDLEVPLRSKTGRWGIYSVNIDIVDIGGEKYNLSTTIDISERKRAEEEVRLQSEALRQANERLQTQARELEAQAVELREQTEELAAANRKAVARESELRLIMDTTPALISYLNADFRYRWVNKNYEHWFGYTLGKVKGQYIWDVLGSDAWRTIEPYVRRAIAGELVQFETVIPYQGAGSRWVNVTYTPDLDETGAVQGLITYVLDLTQGRQAEEALLQSRAKLDAALASMTDAVVIVDAEGRYIEFNDAFATFYRFKNKTDCSRLFEEYSEIIEMRLPDGRLVPVEDWTLPRALRGEEGRNAEYLLCRKDTGETWVGSFSFNPIRDGEGRITGAVAVARDITEQRRAEDELRKNTEAIHQSSAALIASERAGKEANERFRVMFEGHRAVMLLIEPETGAIVDANHAAVAFYGFSREQLRGMHIDQINQLSPEKVAAERRKAVELVSSEFIFPHRLANGDLRWVEVYSSPLTFQGQTMLFSVIHDITARKLAQEELQRNTEALRDSEEKFRSAFANAAIGFAMTTPEGIFIDANPAYCEITGYTASELKTMEFQEIIHPEDYAENMRLISLMNLGQCADFVVENRYRRKDGSSVWVRKSISLVRGSTGEPRWIIALVEDITERKLAEDELNRNSEALLTYTRELQRSNQALEDFTFIASHDLREPLRKVQMFGDLLKNHCGLNLDEKGQDYIERMQQAAARMQGMLDGLLAYARVASQGEPFSQVDLQQVVNEVLSDLEARLVLTGGQVEVEPLPEIEADPLQVRQLIQNLVGNALKFHYPGEPPRVKITCLPVDGQQVAIEIKDNGIGFDPQDATDLFKPFHRLRGRSEFEGSGMGLAICSKIVERHSGSISADSVPGEGSTFRVVLPIRQRR